MKDRLRHPGAPVNVYKTTDEIEVERARRKQLREEAEKKFAEEMR